MTAPSTSSQRPPPKTPTDPELRIREERLESMKTLAGQLAHDFNNFIAPLLGYASLIKEEVPPDSQAMQYAVAMDNSARKSERIMETILMAARPQRRFRPIPTNLKMLLQTELDTWSGNLPADAHITLRTDLAPCELIADPAQWRNVFQQVLSNARFALATGGILEVALHKRELTSQRADELGLANLSVFELVFRDNGLGMPPAVKSRAFDPFFSTRPKSLGLGLGLTIVHSITRLHEGQVILESTENDGTTVTLWLPESSHLSSHSQSRPDPAQTKLPQVLISKGKKILLAEDDALVLEVVRACLVRAGYEVLVARDGQEALELFKKFSQELGLVLSDVTMPQMSGIELVLQIRQIKPEATVVLMSGDAEATREEKLAKLDPRRPYLLKKPFAVKDLMEIIRSQTA
jgi:CheY-like chemotaxis protein